jgi:hypothetical protein
MSGDCEGTLLQHRRVPGGFLASNFEDHSDPFGKVLETLFPGIALTIRARNLKTGRPETAFVRFSCVQHGGESFHAKECHASRTYASDHEPLAPPEP